jgi:uncharacterized FlaG/YvyC family protein
MEARHVSDLSSQNEALKTFKETASLSKNKTPAEVKTPKPPKIKSYYFTSTIRFIVQDQIMINVIDTESGRILKTIPQSEVGSFLMSLGRGSGLMVDKFG